jgi:hypothetical protein
MPNHAKISRPPRVCLQILRRTADDPQPPLVEIGSCHSPRTPKTEKVPFATQDSAFSFGRQLRSDSGHWPWLDVLPQPARSRPWQLHLLSVTNGHLPPCQRPGNVRSLA